MEQIRDGKVLHFLKELPAWCVLAFIFLIVLAIYQFRQDDFIPRLLDAAFGGLLTSLMSNRRPSTNISADTLQTDSMSTNSMDNASISTKTINANVDSVIKDPNDSFTPDLGPNNKEEISNDNDDKS